MFLALLLQISGVTPPAGEYSSQALSTLIADAARINRRVPVELRSYRARLDSEMAFIIRQPDATEAVGQVEQMENDLRWLRSGEYEQRVIGYRSRAVGPTLSGLSYMRTAWSVPVLYGNRMSLFFGRDTTRAARPSRDGKPAKPRTPLYAVHPLADDRDSVYRFSGGDTVTTLLVDGRQIPIVRVDVEPIGRVTRRTLVFHGEVDLDATRHQIVRMRGHFLTIGTAQRSRVRLSNVGVAAVAYVELINGEISSAAGRFWLPSYQRVEMQASLPILGESRSVFRLVSRFHDYVINDTLTAVVAGDADSLAVRHHRLTFAPRESLSTFSAWPRELGSLTAAVHSDDFADVAPDAWRPDGPPRLELRGERFADFFRYNRIEGAFTGAALSLRLRDAAPGVSGRAKAGWAWAEQTVRGGVSGEWLRGDWLLGSWLERALANTNDFLLPLEGSATVPALLGAQDSYDYVDRWSAGVSLVRAIKAGRETTARLETGFARDRAVTPHVRGGIIRADSQFRDNRGIAEGSYVRSALSLVYHADMNSMYVLPGVGATLGYERGDGQLRWQRAEGRISARRSAGRMTYATRVDGGILQSKSPPPQQLYELGGTQALPGYDYKEFAGNRAAVVRGLVMYDLPYRGTPIRVFRGLYLPSLAPAISVGIQGGWTSASNAAALASIRQLGVRAGPGGSTVPISGPSDGIRSTVDVQLRLFGGAIGVGVARPVDHHAPWKLVFGASQ